MKTKLLNTLAVFFISISFFACKDGEILTQVESNSKEIKQNSIKLDKLLDGNEVDILNNAVILTVSLKKEHNNDYQVIHIEGKYRMPYLIMGKFKTDFNRNDCSIKEVDLRVVSLIDNKFFGFVNSPKIERDTNGLLKLYAEIEETAATTNERRRIQNISIKAIHDEIMDMKIKNSEELQAYFDEEKEYNENDIIIQCCGGAICKVRLSTGG